MSLLQITVIGEDEAARELAMMGARALDLRPALGEIRRELIAGNRRQFESRGSYFGSGWAPLAEATIRRKGGDDPLVATGKLRNSLIGGAGRRTRITRSGVSVGTSADFARFAHSGTSHQPARQLVGIAPSELMSAKRTISRYITDGIVA